VYFWANENNEPIHVHVSKGDPSPNATKIWLTMAGKCVVATNGSRIPDKELNKICELVEAQFFYICRKWKEFYIVDSIKFYC